MKRPSKQLKLMAASACLSLAAAHQGPVINSGENLFSITESKLCSNDPFDPTSTHHILESQLSGSNDDLCHDAFLHKMQVQYFDHVKDSTDQDWSYVPTSVIAHRVSYQPQCRVLHTATEPQLQVVKERHVRVKTCWKNGETSWVPADGLRQQNPFVLINYATINKLTKHPDFSWTTKYLDNKNVIAKLANHLVMAGKSHHAAKFKFGVEIPRNVARH